MRTPFNRRRLGLLATAFTAALAGPRTGSATTPETASMGPLTKGPGKRPEPPQSTLDLKTHIDGLRLQLSIAYTDQSDPDVAALLAVQLAALGRVARIGLAHAVDTELRSMCQRLADTCDAEGKTLQTWRSGRRGADS